MNADKLQARLRASEDYSFLRLRGVIDEDNHLDGLFPRLEGSVLVVDVAEVERINSCGVRDWVNWLGKVEGNGHRTVLIRCSPAIIGQVNLVTNFAGGAIIHSFYAPYYCSACDKELQKLIETEALLTRKPARAPSFRCSDCGGELDFDDIEASYFAFIDATDPDAIDHRLKRLVDAVSPDLESKIRALNDAGSAPLSGPLHTINRSEVKTTTPSGSSPDDAPVADDPIAAAVAERSDQNRPPQWTPGTSQALVPARNQRLLVLFVALVILVIGLIIYLAVSGV